MATITPEKIVVSLGPEQVKSLKQKSTCHLALYDKCLEAGEIPQEYSCVVEYKTYLLKGTRIQGKIPQGMLVELEVIFYMLGHEGRYMIWCKAV